LLASTVGTTLRPLKSPLLKSFSGKDIGPHTLGIERRRFPEVADIDCYFLFAGTICNTEKIPSGVSTSVGVDPQKEIELIRAHFDDTIEVAPFEGSVEDELLVWLQSGVHALEGSIEESSFELAVLPLT
jgi:hypothetical protein